ncbi:MAG: DUF177 domain-containing protein [Erythrobacter sp.]
MSELERPIKSRALPSDAIVVEADTAERAALAVRFELAEVAHLRAEVSLESDGNAVRASGTLQADVTQVCAVSAEEFAVNIAEEIAFRFIPESETATLDHEAEGADIEVELSDEDCDEITYSGDAFDLGEAIAQSLGLAIDPYAEGPNADAAREKAGIVDENAPSGPLAEALMGLKKG